jgi:threonine synthase
MAAYAARAGMRAIVFIPAGQIAYGKLSQSMEYGATVVEIEGNFDDAMQIVRELADETGLYLLNSINPFRLEGQKAIAIEMMEQLDWHPPDWLVVPGGNLGNSSAIGKGLRELFDLGFISAMPRLAIVQAEGAAPLYDYVTSGRRGVLAPVSDPTTLATAIKIGNPVSWQKALRALDWTNGVVEKVTEQEIADARAMIGRDGIGCEPASAATLAGIVRLVAAGAIKRGESVIAVLTGNLLKDPDYTVDYHLDRLSLAGRQIAGRYANKSVRAAANKDAIRRLLDL